MEATQTTIERLLARLSDRSNAEPAAGFPRDRGAADHPGLYAWYAAPSALDLLSAPFDEPLPELIYAGQAGATSSRAGLERAATLHSRIRGNHLRGNLKASTFRRTLAAILRGPLGLELDRPKVLTASSNTALTAWIGAHLELVVAPHDDRARLAALEHAVLLALDPPLNLMGMPRTPTRSALKALRAQLAQPG